MDNDDSTGRCISCGFLAQWDAHQDGPPPHFYEYPTKDREIPGYTVARIEKDWQINTFPRCYFDCADLWKEIDALEREKSTTRTLAMAKVFDTDRQCKKWHTYTPGFSPQEHWEEVRMLELELKRQEFEKKMDDSNKCFQVKITCILALIAFLEIVVTVLQLFYPTGIPWFQSPSPIPPMPGF